MRHSGLLVGMVVSVYISFSGMCGHLDNWEIRSSPSSNQLNGITYGNGLFVAVGNNATILTSTNGALWTLQPIDTTTPTLRCAAFGNGRYVVGGEGAALIRSSTDGVHWTNGLSTAGAEIINAITYSPVLSGSPLFVAVGRGPTLNSSYILTSSNGLDWAVQTAPTTNTLRGVAPCFSDSLGWAETLFTAAGDFGTIISSSDGTNWVAESSGTTVPLRAVGWYYGMFVAGDSGTVLASAYPSGEGVWAPVAPTSFNVRGLRPSMVRQTIVAVGNYQNMGRLHASASADGHTSWPGQSTEFAQPLNGVAFGGGSFVAVGDGGMIVQSVGLTNEWTKTTSGYWEEPFWSLGEMPSLDQDLVAFRNPGSKTLAIGNTTTNFPNALAIRNLLVDGPPGSFNELLLNYAGLTVPLSVRSNFIVGPNGSLAGYYSALTGGSLSLSATGSLSMGCVATFDRLTVGDTAPSELDLVDSFLTAGLVNVGQGAAGTLNLSGGMADILNLQVPGMDATSGNLLQLSGTLVTRNLTLGAVLSPAIPPGRGNLVQYGGAHTNWSMLLEGEIRHQNNTHYGSYSLVGGQLSSGSLLVRGGVFTQSGGTNYVRELKLDEAGTFSLIDGTLFSLNTTVTTCCCVSSDFIQNGGNHFVQNRLFLEYLSSYQLRGGTLSAPFIEVGPGAALSLQGGNITGPGLVTIRGGVVRAAGHTNQLGQLQVIGEPGLYCGTTQPTNSQLDVGLLGGSGSTVLRFADSHDVPWLGSPLSILHWNPTTNGFGPDHIFVGTNADGLTPAQLSQAIFVNPVGWPVGNYPASILATGEIVPAVPPPLAFTRTSDSLVLTWMGDYYQLVSATNVFGPYLPVPGAISPFTNAFMGPQRFFRLNLPPP